MIPPIFRELLSVPGFRSFLRDQHDLNGIIKDVFPELNSAQLNRILTSLLKNEIRTRLIIDAMTPDQVKTVWAPRFTKLFDTIDLESLHKRISKISKCIFHIQTLVERKTPQNFPKFVQETSKKINQITQLIALTKAKLDDLSDLTMDQIEAITDQTKYITAKEVYEKGMTIKEQLNQISQILFSSNPGSLRDTLTHLNSHYAKKDEDDKQMPAYEALAALGILNINDCREYAHIIGKPQMANPMQYIVNLLARHKIETKADLIERKLYPIDKTQLAQLLRELENKSVYTEET